MSEQKNADEIIQKLRRIADSSRSKHGVLIASADMHEQQRARIAELKAQLATSRRREHAAVADIKKPSVCECCVHCWACQGDEVCLDNDYMNFEWRGPQNAGKGETE